MIVKVRKEAIEVAKSRFGATVVDEAKGVIEVDARQVTPTSIEFYIDGISTGGFSYKLDEKDIILPDGTVSQYFKEYTMSVPWGEEKITIDWIEKPVLSDIVKKVVTRILAIEVPEKTVEPRTKVDKDKKEAERQMLISMGLLKVKTRTAKPKTDKISAVTPYVEEDEEEVKPIEKVSITDKAETVKEDNESAVVGRDCFTMFGGF